MGGYDSAEWKDENSFRCRYEAIVALGDKRRKSKDEAVEQMALTETGFHPLSAFLDWLWRRLMAGHLELSRLVWRILQAVPDLFYEAATGHGGEHEVSTQQENADKEY
jgi:hypothetical protein